MVTLRFSIPGEPKGKGRPRLGRSGHAFTPKDTVNYENLVKLAFSTAYPEHDPVDPVIPIKCEMKAYYFIPKSTTKKKYGLMLEGKLFPLKKPDLDNIVKIICDALNGIAYHDDSQIQSVLIEKYYSLQPRVEVVMRYEQREE